MKNKKLVIFLSSFFVILGIGFAIWAYPIIQSNHEMKIGYFGGMDHAIRPFKFANQDGDSITKDDMKGKIVVVEYFYSTCKGICPKMNDNMAKVYETFKNDDNVLILSHTVDPETDSVARLKEYSKKYNADSKHWMFLTGDKKALYDQARYSYLITAVDTVNKVDINEDFIHEKYFVLVDQEGKLRAHENKDGKLTLYDGTDPESVQLLIDDIHQLEKQSIE